jgi:hypothetical protein
LALAGTLRCGRDPNFIGKLRDIVGLYVNPPTHAVVLTADEESQIQALDRTHPGCSRFSYNQVPDRLRTSA